ncbi:MAG: 3-deoxy-manno-octulosonate cytidylyltransferase [Syntrophus sp. PtaB.Bin075]|nr:MAG: 3-deoxy-manno-octulosonate cytidylyltransferase [Syntrophus sp. PtaB.Bin075]
MKTVGCIIARTNSSRLPQKVLRKINNKQFIEIIIEKMKRVRELDELYLCTSVDSMDRILLDVAVENGIKAYAGSRDSVIDRLLDVARIENADKVIRITGDNLFTDEIYLELMLEYHELHAVDYTRSEFLPLGVTAEVINVDFLRRLSNMMDSNQSQYMMLYLFQPEYSKCQVLIPEKRHRHPNWSLTVDTQEDLKRAERLLSFFDHIPNYGELLDILENENIPSLEYGRANSVKFPANLLMTYVAFRTEMEQRIARSIITELKEGFYDAKCI